MSDLSAFLLARIAEDEEMADRSVQFGDKGALLVTFRLSHLVGAPDSPPVMLIHPARVLAECGAKRRIVELHAPTQGMPWCRSCGRSDIPNGAHEWPCSTILSLAAVYRDHVDYRTEWES